MERVKNVVQFYVLCNKLKDVIRTGWQNWGVKRDRIESVAEHIYGVQMLAIAMWSEYKYDVDLFKVLSMIAVHEMEEILIGDFTPFQIDKETKQIIGKKAVQEILQNLSQPFLVADLIDEYEMRHTAEAKFVFQCDKLECDLQCKLYDEQNCVDLAHQENNIALSDPIIDEYLKTGKPWSEMWLKFGQERNKLDENFTAVSNYAIQNKINI